MVASAPTKGLNLISYHFSTTGQFPSSPLYSHTGAAIKCWHTIVSLCVVFFLSGHTLCFSHCTPPYWVLPVSGCLFCRCLLVLDHVLLEGCVLAKIFQQEQLSSSVTSLAAHDNTPGTTCLFGPLVSTHVEHLSSFCDSFPLFYTDCRIEVGSVAHFTWAYVNGPPAERVTTSTVYLGYVSGVCCRD